MWKVIGASVIGTSHKATGTGCEDACGWRAEHDATYLAVADGAGGRPHSARGAALAVEHALRLADTVNCYCEPGVLAERMRSVFAGVRGQLAELACAEGHAIGDYAATLAVAVLGGELVCVGQIGDTIAVAGNQGRYETLAPAPRPEYVNETTFVTDEGWTEHVRIDVRPASEADAVFLSTDGLRFKILADLRDATPFTPFFEDAQAYARSPVADADAIQEFLH